MKTISDYLNGIQRSSYSAKEKAALIAYMSDRKYLFGASTKKLTDLVTGETVYSRCHHLYNDGVYEWTSSEIYHLEKYDLKLSEAFIRHVLEKSEQ